MLGSSWEPIGNNKISKNSTSPLPKKTQPETLGCMPRISMPTSVLYHFGLGYNGRAWDIVYMLVGPECAAAR